MYICLEGIDGCGKTTQLSLLQEYFQNKGYRVLTTREPGSTDVGKCIRDLVLNNEISPTAELLLYLADRAQHNYEILEQESKNYDIVLSDRSFLSTFVYQGMKFSTELLISLHKLLKLITRFPDYIFVIDVSPETAISRFSKRDEDLTKFEKRGKEYITEIRKRYLRLSKEFMNVFVINGEQDQFNVLKDITNIIEKNLK